MRTLILAAAILAGAAAHAGDFELKGIELGKPPAGQVGPTTVAGVGADLSYDTRDGLVETVRASFESVYFDRVSDAIKGKYGAPASVERIPVTNGFGAKFMVTIEKWVGPSGDQMIVSDHMDFANGVVMLETKAKADRDAARAAKAKSDL
jgi:hypothetical protein